MNLNFNILEKKLNKNFYNIEYHKLLEHYINEINNTESINNHFINLKDKDDNHFNYLNDIIYPNNKYTSDFKSLHSIFELSNDRITNNIHISLNYMKMKIPNFLYYYGTINYKNISMKVYENHNFNSLNKLFWSLRIKDIINIFIQCVLSLKMANSYFNYIHGNLTCENIFIKELKTPINIEYKVNGKKYVITTYYVAYIKNYDLPNHNNINYDILNLLEEYYHFYLKNMDKINSEHLNQLIHYIDQEYIIKNCNQSLIKNFNENNREKIHNIMINIKEDFSKFFFESPLFDSLINHYSFITLNSNTKCIQCNKVIDYEKLQKGNIDIYNNINDIFDFHHCYLNIQKSKDEELLNKLIKNFKYSEIINEYLNDNKIQQFDNLKNSLNFQSFNNIDIYNENNKKDFHQIYETIFYIYKSLKSLERYKDIIIEICKIYNDEKLLINMMEVYNNFHLINKKFINELKDYLVHLNNHIINKLKYDYNGIEKIDTKHFEMIFHFIIKL